VIAGVLGGGSIRIPWAIAFGQGSRNLIGRATISEPEFTASDTKPALLSLDAGRVVPIGGHPEILPLKRLDVVLWRADGTQVGTLALLRDVLPGRYTFGLTGRDPDGQRLAPGNYLVRIVAYPVQRGKPSRKTVRFSLR
jgi:hypothetical protein